MHDALGEITVFTGMNRKRFIQKRIYLILGSPLEVIGIFIEDHFCEKTFRLSNLMVHITPYISSANTKTYY